MPGVRGARPASGLAEAALPIVLLTPGRIGTLALRNRAVFPPLLLNLASDRGEVTDRLVDHYRALAAGGYGLLVSECTFVQYKGGVATRGIALYDDHFRPGFARLAKAVHAEGARLGVQLFFDGAGRTFASDESVSVGPSDLSTSGGPSMRPLAAAEIEKLVSDFASAAGRAVEEGIDLIELHMAHGHLLGRFLSPYFNRRIDEFGGSTEGRMRFPIAVVRATRAAIGSRVPITARLCLSERLPGGLELEEAIAIAVRLRAEGIAAVHSSAGTGTTPEGQDALWPTSFSPEAPFAADAREFRRRTGVTTIFAGKVTSATSADDLLRKGVADFVSLGRAGLADPAWLNKHRRSLVAVPCIGCNQGCVDSQVNRKEVTCTVNPLIGFERQVSSTQRMMHRRVVVIGGGIAGLVYATKIARRGASTVVVERSDALGGQYRWASSAPGKEQYARYLDYLIADVAASGLEVRLETDDEQAADVAASADRLVWAGGASPMQWPDQAVAIPVLLGWGCFSAPLLRRGRRLHITVVGAGQAGCDAAIWAAALGHAVTLLDKTVDPTRRLGSRRRAYLEAFHRTGVQLRDATLAAFDQRGRLSLEGLDGTPRPSHEADAIIAAVGRMSNPRPPFLGPSVVSLGDAVRPATVADAIRQATFSAEL